MPTLSHLQLSVNPVLLRLGSLEIRYYGVLLTLSFVFGYLWLIRAERGSILSEARRVEGLLDFFLITSLGALLGAKLTSLALALLEGSDNLQFTIDNLLNGGGLSFHGGLLGGALAAWLYAKRHKNFPLLQVADHLALYLPIGIILVRLGNFINQELVGYPTQAPWGVVFALKDSTLRHPTPLYEAAVALVVGFILWFLGGGNTRRVWRSPQRGELLLYFLVLYSAGRFLTDFFREQTVYAGFSLAQWTSIVLVALCFWSLARRPLSASV